MAMHRHRRSHGVLAVVGLAALAAFNSCSFVPPAAEDSKALQRRQVVQALATQGLLLSAAAPAVAGDRDRATMVLNARRNYLPRILANYKKLTAAGAIDDDYVSNELPKFVNALDLYGSIQRQAEAPDKVSKTLMKDAQKIKDAGKEKNYAEVMTLLDKYIKDIPEGPGKYTWDSEVDLKGAQMK